MSNGKRWGIRAIASLLIFIVTVIVTPSRTPRARAQSKQRPIESIREWQSRSRQRGAWTGRGTRYKHPSFEVGDDPGVHPTNAGRMVRALNIPARKPNLQ